MKILFEVSLIACHGNIVIAHDYPHFNEEILNNESFIITKTPEALSHNNPHNFRHDPVAIEYIKKNHKLFFYNNCNDIKKVIDDNKIDLLHTMTGGRILTDEEMNFLNTKICVHSVFGNNDVHGNVFAYISEWLSNTFKNGTIPFVPHMVNLPNINDDMREILNIPKNAIVIGRHGSRTTFNILFAFDVVNRIVQERKDIYFLFLNTDNSSELNRNKQFIKHERIIFLPNPIYDLVEKTKFINTCDAMLHARINGESFGLAPAEFSVRNKPVITWSALNYPHDRAHIDMLGDKAIYYNDYSDLYNILKNFYPQPDKNWDAYSEKYNPKVVMEKFKKVFIDKN